MDKNIYLYQWSIKKGLSITLPLLLILTLIIALPLIFAYRPHVQRQITHHELRKTYSLDERFNSDLPVFESALISWQTQHLLQLSLAQSQTDDLLNQFHQEVAHWGKAHPYHDDYNGVTYNQDYEYDQKQGFGSEVDDAVSQEHTVDGYQVASKLIQSQFMHLRAMEADAIDKAPWYEPHASDLRLIRYHHLTGQVVVVSFIEQTCRIYQDGKLINAFLVTTGNSVRPSPAGLWHILRWQSPTIFRSFAPVGSAAWYPATPIHYAMQYRENGYYLHDSWWRAYYGPGTNFPHYDPGGEQFAGNGSHGCINLSVADAAWMYAQTGDATTIITY